MIPNLLQSRRESQDLHLSKSPYTHLNARTKVQSVLLSVSYPTPPFQKLHHFLHLLCRSSDHQRLFHLQLL
ncbi:hypothetical protein HanXRQr2_Chr02g0071511 [Helianthus annuus]|uniref:Uncharacterized protein n=1 Tax=Helianthus annuus TaxID=4232 RepID=A0A9K3JPE1_HELAN|nr:hypothetical protein HanXRQr2_Chr02g0071511 [Helianthus annuus]